MNDEKRDEYIRKVIRMCSDKYVISEWYMKKLDEVVEGTKRYNEMKEREEALREQEELSKKVYKNAFNDGFNNGFDDGFNNGFDDGFQDGFQDGIKNATNEYIKKMLDKNIDVSLISAITNLTEEEIININKI